MPININNCYWRVNGHDAAVFSSAKPGWVALDDKDYKAWQDAGNPVRPIFCDAELCHSLIVRGASNSIVAACGVTDFGPSLSYDDKVGIIVAIGCKIVSSDPTINGTYELGDSAWRDMRDEAQYIQTWPQDGFSGGEKTFPWRTREETVTFSDTKKFMDVVKALADYLTTWKRYLGAPSDKMPTLGTTTIS